MHSIFRFFADDIIISSLTNNRLIWVLTAPFELKIVLVGMFFRIVPMFVLKDFVAD